MTINTYIIDSHMGCISTPDKSILSEFLTVSQVMDVESILYSGCTVNKDRTTLRSYLENLIDKSNEGFKVLYERLDDCKESYTIIHSKL